MKPLTPAEHRVLQVLLHLPNPVPLKLIVPAAVRDHRKPNSDTARHVIMRLKRKRPRLGIGAEWGKGYSLKSNPVRLCAVCGERPATVKRCLYCQRAYKLGYWMGATKAAKRARRAVSVEWCHEVPGPVSTHQAPPQPHGHQPMPPALQHPPR